MNKNLVLDFINVPFSWINSRDSRILGLDVAPKLMLSVSRILFVRRVFIF
ncbi:MAG: hypothetical protein HN392_02580 [Anaerolineae bacterium]|nr:hypothetical protein [Anaerolineae bacterium]